MLIYQFLNVSLNVCLFYREEVGHGFVEVFKVLMILRIKKLMELLIIEQRVKSAQFCNLDMFYINNKVVEFKHHMYIIISNKLWTAKKSTSYIFLIHCVWYMRYMKWNIAKSRVWSVFVCVFKFLYHLI